MQLHGDESLLLLMLFDFQDSKFTLRLGSNHDLESIPEAVAKVAEALWKHRTKLNAALARLRIERDAMRISQLIPNPTTRKIYEANVFSPCYARVNPFKVGNVQTEVVNQLLNEGFVMVASEGDLHRYSHKCMCLLLAFSRGCHGALDVHDLVESGRLVLQVSCKTNKGWVRQDTKNTMSGFKSKIL